MPTTRRRGPTFLFGPIPRLQHGASHVRLACCATAVSCFAPRITQWAQHHDGSSSRLNQAGYLLQIGMHCGPGNHCRIRRNDDRYDCSKGVAQIVFARDFG